jgi:hypothetical protein
MLNPDWLSKLAGLISLMAACLIAVIYSIKIVAIKAIDACEAICNRWQRFIRNRQRMKHVDRLPSG